MNTEVTAGVLLMHHFLAESPLEALPAPPQGAPLSLSPGREMPAEWGYHLGPQFPSLSSLLWFSLS